MKRLMMSVDGLDRGRSQRHGLPALTLCSMSLCREIMYDMEFMYGNVIANTTVYYVRGGFPLTSTPTDRAKHLNHAHPVREKFLQL